MRSDLARAQLIVAVVGLVPALVFAIAFVRNGRRLVAVSLASAVALYAAWALLADAAHHGWDNLKFFPF